MLQLEKTKSELTLNDNRRNEFAKEFANPDDGASFNFSNLSFEVKTSKGPKQILKNISGTVKAGQLMAILGPSGAGKTTLMNMLTLEKSTGLGSGSITLNGQGLTRNTFTRNCYYVPQEGAHYGFLTPRETLTYAGRLFSNDVEAVKRRVETLLSIMGLESCADVKVGNAFFQGLSGGQKKRLSIAVALLSQPLVLFLDEPTSGLDAAAAAGIMLFLRDLVSIANIMIICTIHQPSTQVYDSFDSVLFMANGRTAYIGTASQAVPYFTNIGYPMPANSNPAEFILDLVNDEFTSSSQVTSILDTWSPAKLPSASDEVVAKRKGGRDISSMTLSASAPSFISQLFALLSRHGLLVLRDPTIYVGRIFLFFSMAIFFSIVYINQRVHDQENVLNKMWLTLWYVGPAASLSVVAVYATNIEFKSIKNEMKNGMVRPGPYILTNIMLQIPLLIIVTFLGYVIPVYAVSNFDATHLPAFIGLLAVNFWIFECLANIQGVAMDNFLIGMMGVMNFWFSAFLFAGIMIKIDDIPWPFRAFTYILPFKYSLSSLLYTEYQSLTFDGAHFINGTSSFACDPDVAAQSCYGPTGFAALDSLHNNWGIVSSENNVGRDFGILVAMAVFYKIVFAALIFIKSRETSEPVNDLLVKDESGALKINVADKANNNNNANNEKDQGAERVTRQKEFIDEFANKDLNAKFTFKNMWYEVDDSKNKENPSKIKKIIKGVSGSVKAGEMLVIMGPSGAGKTTLLNMLTLESTTGKAYGDIELNGQALTRDLFLSNCFYVPQYPALYAFLTPRETLTLTAQLYDSSSPDEKKISDRVNTLIEVLGLSSCADIKIGNEFFLGLSGGQKKRLSIAVGLLSRPLVLFLDEPTTGLDAAAAASLMSVLHSLATDAHILIVCTIHQPSAPVFNRFDNIMLLARGETAYLGQAAQVVSYFAKIGFPMPGSTTAAEYMLDLINDEFTSKEQVRRVVDLWGVHGEQLTINNKLPKANESNTYLARPTRGAPLLTQIRLLLTRQSKLIMRDPMLYIGRAIGYLFSNMFFCAVYEAARERSQSRVVPRMFCDMWCIGTTAMFAMLIVFGQNRELFTIKNEVKNGMIKPASYLIANTIFQLPLLFIMVLFGFLLPFYGVMLSNPSNLIQLVIIVTAMLWSFEAIAETLAVQFDNFLIGMLMFLNFWFSSFLFCGVIAAESIVPWPFKLFIYISPLRYGLETLVYLDFEGDNYNDNPALFDPKTLECLPQYLTSCWGGNGHRVLSALHTQFEAIDDVDRTWRDVGICLALAVGFKFFYVIMLYMKTTSVALPSAAGDRTVVINKKVAIENIELAQVGFAPSPTDAVNPSPDTLSQEQEGASSVSSDGASAAAGLGQNAVTIC